MVLWYFLIKSGSEIIITSDMQKKYLQNLVAHFTLFHKYTVSLINFSYLYFLICRLFRYFQLTVNIIISSITFFFSIAKNSPKISLKCILRIEVYFIVHWTTFCNIFWNLNALWLHLNIFLSIFNLKRHAVYKIFWTENKLFFFF